jgi:hypothetical protein
MEFHTKIGTGIIQYFEGDRAQGFRNPVSSENLVVRRQLSQKPGFLDFAGGLRNGFASQTSSTIKVETRGEFVR